MEALLNAVWLLVAVSLLFLWRHRWLPQIRKHSLDRRRQSFVGLVCVLAFLFPAISLSDDLHPAVVTLADTKSAYAVVHNHDASRPGARSHATPHFFSGPLPQARLRAALWGEETLIARSQTAIPAGPPRGSFSGRAPPLPS